jgi:DNA-binding IclR family transcriptional regulator
MVTQEAPRLSEVAGAQTISRAIHVLRLIATHAPDGMRLVDVARQMGLERPTAHRLLKALTAEGMAVQDAATRRYSLGPLLFELGILATHRFNLKEVSQPVVAQLAEETGDTTFLFLRSGYDAVCISRIQGSYPIQTPSVPLGSRQPLGVSAGGLALLASLPEPESTALIKAVSPRLGAYGELDEDKVLELCGAARHAGYAVTGNHAVPGVRAIGLPVFNAAGSPVAAITVAATHARMTDQRITSILPRLRNAARELTRLLDQ